MFTARNLFTASNSSSGGSGNRRGRLAVTAIAAGAALVLSGCTASDPLAPEESNAAGGPIVIGSQAYYSNEIIAEIYAQALENAGFEVERKFQIGQRDAYIPELEAGNIALFPEYTGNLLQFYSPDTTATQADEVYDELVAALPDGLTALQMSPATDQDSYNVTEAFAQQNGGLQSLADLKDVTVPLILGGAPELAERPYGPTGLEQKYGVTVGFSATGDTTVDALLAGVVNLANVYSADPRIQTEGLVTLADPEGLFLASNVVPIVNAELAEEIAAIINAVSAAMSPADLVALNVKSTVDQLSATDIAAEFLTDNGLL